jgi:SAM-dependent methyltransferase|tara:strand:+ start:172 stop:1638 length:1467 start_codon:yes stop_codon:yes gene_type:complete
MVDRRSDSPQVTQSWDTYWQSTGDVGAFASGGVSHPTILAFWEEFFQSVKQDYEAPRIIDIASGNGAVVELALAAVGNAGMTCLDVSAAAITNIQSRFPGVQGLVADARAIPLSSGVYDIATSQFGVEYAGLEAIDEVARLVKAGGRLALLLHNEAGSILKECQASLDAVLRLQQCRFIPHSIEMLSAGFNAVRGADRAPYDAAATRLAPAVQALESIMDQHGEHVAGDTISRLYADVDRIHHNMQRHDSKEVLDWLNRMDSELDAYAGRMSSMCNAAIDEETFDQICAGLHGSGYTAERAEPLPASKQGPPLAWVLVAANESNAIRSVTAPKAEGSADAADSHEQEELQAWTKQQFGAAIRQLMQTGVVESQFIEAKPAWVFPFRFLIGKIRRPRDAAAISWFICGEVPTAHLGSGVASTPREAARHFALNWQLEAARNKDLSNQNNSAPSESNLEDDASQLAGQAEALYALVEDAGLWQPVSGSQF